MRVGCDDAPIAIACRGSRSTARRPRGNARARAARVFFSRDERLARGRPDGTRATRAGAASCSRTVKMKCLITYVTVLYDRDGPSTDRWSATTSWATICPFASSPRAASARRAWPPPSPPPRPNTSTREINRRRRRRRRFPLFPSPPPPSPLPPSRGRRRGPPPPGPPPPPRPPSVQAAEGAALSS